ncbi:hypothetical protein LZG74_12595 [Dyadobacter sp. CY327]|uniref:hypothetical protein n=1 Tax=Dyadobacter sp. CY327 TaxID=2907301 RepID=UPI001F176C48|nr:hypothetical protein [Dyadobacter sp. CY327]MCE7071150.1 hypothetical protein [Dyadobacter sp. CY327]
MRTIKSKSATPGTIKAADYFRPFETTSTLHEPGVSYQKLDPAKYGRLISCELSDEELEMANDPNVKPFAYVSDSAAYVRKIRKTSKP